MNFDLSEDQAMVKAAVERFVADIYGGDLAARRAGRATAAGFSPDAWARLADMGVLGVGTAHGGLSGGAAEVMVAMEALGRGLVAEPVLEAAIIPGFLLSAANSAALAGVLDGSRVVALAHAERAARHDLMHVETQAIASVGGVVIDGAKIAVLAGGTADSFIVSARGDDGIGLYLVSADAAELERRNYRLADGSVAAELVLRGVTGQRLNANLADVIPMARLAAAAEMLGLMGLLLDQTLAYLKTRQQFGQPLGAFQVIQHRMTDAYVLVEQARSQVLRAALAEPADFARAAAGAKAFVGESALTVAHTAVQMHGGMGITDELAIGHALKRIRVLALVFGDADSAIDDYRDAA